MRTTVLALSLLLTCSAAHTAQAQLWVGIDSPTANALVGDDVYVSVSAMGPVTSVTASSGAHTAALTKGLGTQPFRGTLSFAGDTAGAKAITVLGSDGNGNTASATLTVQLDRLPVITVASPVEGHVVRDGTLSIDASCTDDSGGDCALSSSLSSVMAPNHLVTSASLASKQGMSAAVVITAKDSRGQTSTVTTNVFVESSQYLREVLQGPSGSILAFDGHRALVQSGDRVHLSIKAVGSAPATEIYAGPDLIWRGDLYGSTEAYFTTGPVSSPSPNTKHTVRHWHGQLESLNAVDERVNGKWLALVRNLPLWDPQYPDAFAQELALRNLESGEEVVTSAARQKYSTYNVFDLALAENGDLFWGENMSSAIGSVYWRQKGVVSQVTGTSRIPGGLAVDQLHATLGVTLTGGLNEISLYTGNNVETICSSSVGCPPVVLNQGWVGYGTATGSYPTPTVRAFRRSPQGQIEELSGFPPSAKVEALNAQGRVAVTAANKRYLESAPMTAVSSALGRAVAIGDKWYLLLGRSAFEIVPSGVIDEPDAGTADAGILDGSTRPADDAGQAGMDQEDGGARPVDAAVATMDAAAASDSGAAQAADGSTPGSSRHDDGCSLDPHGKPGGGSSVACMALLLAALLARGRRQRC